MDDLSGLSFMGGVVGEHYQMCKHICLNMIIIVRCHCLIENYGTVNVLKHHFGYITFTHQASPTTKLKAPRVKMNRYI